MNKFVTQITIALPDGMLANKASISRPATLRSLFWVQISSTKVKQFWTVMSFCIISGKIGTITFASL